MAWPFDLHGQTRRSMSYLKQGNAFDVLRSILNDVSRRRETRIGLNGMYNLLARTSVTLPSESGQADEILSDVLVQISKEYKLTWKLLIEPQEHFYVFNVVTVKAQPR